MPYAPNPDTVEPSLGHRSEVLCGEARGLVDEADVASGKVPAVAAGAPVVETSDPSFPIVTP
ncbi:hypothetical protein [Cellulosimicrobium cellulans]|uniref:hypothetical protein n=1 Tax=Cellulosimicrobium cellulans TaxID=1710 RepID=UPI002404EC31|nr:hypothetical protein [Cellulosimicrobium cellulans]MDF9876020.1 hypothetical protein [Cellulosimicrobium cellulans]